MSNTILGAIDTLNKSTCGSKATSETSAADISKMLRTIQDVVDDAHLQHRILRQLVFEDMTSRANQIPKAAKKTYSWAVGDDPLNKGDERRLAWNLFLDWLRAGDKIFHVSGNPGAGKSTLMKFLSQHERAMEELKAWATTKTLISCAFYFWSPGSKAQRTVTGLYRSLLFQALSQCPDLTEEVFPVQFRRMKAFQGDEMVERIQGFDENHIEEAFKLLLSRAVPDEYRLCFFIDGLDEFEGNSLQHEELAKMLQGWVTSGAVKLCVSSRPYPEFTRTFALPEDRQIQLHKLNESDIKAYCLDRLGNDVHAQKRSELCSQLVKEMVRHAQGVFLWVHLVTDILLMGLRQDDPDSVLLARLESLPSDLDKLYTKLREPIEKDRIQKARSDRMLLLAANNPGREDLNAMAFSWLEGQEGDQGGLNNPDFPPASGLDPYSEAEISKRLDHVTKQIDGLARGFLQIITRSSKVPKGHIKSFFSARVQFCHRTARDYLLQTEDRHRAMLNSFPNFESSNLYTRILLAETIHGRRRSDHFPDANILHNFERSFWENVDPDLISKFELAVHKLELARIFNIGRGRDANLIRLEAPKISFTAYAAWCGLDRFVLREVARDTWHLKEKSVGCSVLCAAVSNDNFNLALGLLDMGRGLDQLCEMSCLAYGECPSSDSPCDDCPHCECPYIDCPSDDCPHGTYDGYDCLKVWEKVTLVPASVISLATIFSTSPTYGEGERDWSEELLKLTKGLLKSLRSQKISMRARISGILEPSNCYHREKLIPEIQVHLDIADAFTIVEMLKGRIDGGRPELLNLNTVEDGLIAEHGNSELVRLKEWFKQPIAHPEHPGAGLSKELRIDSVEWSSETLGLVQIDLQEAWARLH